MWLSHGNLWKTFFCAVIVAWLWLAGCGNTCVVGFSINGNGGLIVKAGDPPPVCSVGQSMGAVRVVMQRAQVCESCADATGVHHVFVTVRGVQLQPQAFAEPASSDWFEIAPELADSPRQVDLMGDGTLTKLAENSRVPAGTYRQVRLQLVPGSLSSYANLPAENRCGPAGWNCVVAADGRVAPLTIRSSDLEMSITTGSMEGGSFVVLPDNRIDLRLLIGPRSLLSFSDGTGMNVQYALAGHAIAEREGSAEQ